MFGYQNEARINETLCREHGSMKFQHRSFNIKFKSMKKSPTSNCDCTLDVYVGFEALGANLDQSLTLIINRIEFNDH